MSTTSSPSPASTGRELSTVAGAHPDRPAVVSELGSLTFAELDARAEAVAAALVARGLETGDVIALLCTNRP